MSETERADNRKERGKLCRGQKGRGIQLGKLYQRSILAKEMKGPRVNNRRKTTESQRGDGEKTENTTHA